MRQAEGSRNSPDKFSLNFPKHPNLSLCLNSFLSLLLPYLPFSPEKKKIAVFHLNAVTGRLAGSTECLLGTSLKASPQKPWSDSRQVVESCKEVRDRKTKRKQVEPAFEVLRIRRM